ncbi:hypothetical protein ZOSMA_19G00390 [Zostera marina]|uniref:DUF7906 domain-containing protein n=1 Tax=Zostera marina TaxID=29655 RepID=A0A0K9PQF1_ZOSMR|nr:hypothetical protein ZOSMA_19G00390 [Zostera marina]
MRILHSMLSIGWFLLLVLAGESFGSPSNKYDGGKSSVFSLFNLKSKSKFWSDSVIHEDFDDLEASAHSKMNLHNYTMAENIAKYLNLQEIESLYLAVPVNFIFIGFEGKGNHGFEMSPNELERWFSKIDHTFEHTRVPKIGQVRNLFSKINIDRDENHHLPIVSHINYNFSVHAIHMGEKVNSVFERAIEILSRKDNISDSRNNRDIFWQVDIDGMSSLFTSLVDYLQLGSAYNIFILNPKNDSERGKYGYRRGLSESEIHFIKENKTFQSKLFQSENETKKSLKIEKSNIKNSLYRTHPGTKYSWTVAEESHTEEWYNACLDALNEVKNLYLGKDNDELIVNRVSQILLSMDDSRHTLVKDLKSGDLVGLHAECLTDTWIGNDRWAFIDLSAGPFSWGPVVGGDGVRTENSLPNVGKTIGAVSEISENMAEDHLQDIIKERFSVFGDDHNAIDVLLAEIDIYELFSFKHCKGRRVKLALCEELDERMHDLENELQAFESEEHDESNKQKAIDALKRMESWDLFSNPRDGIQNYTVAHDSFLAHLGSTLWGSMRHIVAPSIADGAYHYYEKVSFQLFFITQEKLRNIRQLPLDLAAVKESLSTLIVPTQKVMFSQTLLSLSEDTSLAMAFSVARRAASVPLLLVNGTYRSTIRTYLDSSILQHQLRRLNDHGSLKGMHSKSRSTLEVPIFWFIHSDPLFIDKYYQAKALDDMVIVAQSNLPSWESHLQCNGQSLLWDLRNPVKSAMASTAEHLSGLLPLHLVYSHAHEFAIEDWTWSVGCNLFSITSQGWHVSQFQLDTISRSYIITSLEESIQTINAAIKLLVKERTTAKGFHVFKSQERMLVESYNSVVALWRRISTISGGLRYGDAMRQLLLLDDASKGFRESVNATLALLHPIHCTREREVKVEVDLTTIPAFLVVFAILWFVLRPRRPKAKIN